MPMLLVAAMLAFVALGYQIGFPVDDSLSLPCPTLMVNSAMTLIIDFNRAGLRFTRINPPPLIWTIHGVVPAPPR